MGKPYLGQLVHYTPRALEFTPKAGCAAFVAFRMSEDTVALTVLGPDGVPYGAPKVAYDPKGGNDTWRFLEDVTQEGLGVMTGDAVTPD